MFWIQPSGISRRYEAPKEEDARHNEGVLTLNPDGSDHDLSGMYICLAYNEAGNVTLTMNVAWPGKGGQHRGDKHPRRRAVPRQVQRKMATVTSTTTIAIITMIKQSPPIWTAIRLILHLMDTKTPARAQKTQEMRMDPERTSMQITLPRAMTSHITSQH